MPLPHPTAFTVFLGIAAVGFLFLLLALFFGGVFEHFDTSFDHEFSHGGPGFFSARVLSVFVTTFGGVGAIATQYGLSPLPSSAVGFLSGVLTGSLVYAFAQFLFRQQASSDVRSADIVGMNARVVITIPKGGVGQIRCRVGEELVDKIARSSDGESLLENTTVRVEDVLGDVVVVTRVKGVGS